jgi:hypothetical protein
MLRELRRRSEWFAYSDDTIEVYDNDHVAFAIDRS